MFDLNPNIVSYDSNLEYGSDSVIEYSLDYIPNNAPSAIFVFIHGYKAFKDWGFYPYLCKRVADLGLVSLRFSFSLSGIIEPKKMLYDVEKFARNNTKREIKEAEYILDLISSGRLELPKGCNVNNEVIICGHSKGAAISVLIANKFSNIKQLILLSPIAKFNRYSERQKALWEKNGKFEFTISGTKQKLFIPFSYLSDIISNDYDSMLLKEVSRLQVPLQILHGKQDKTVSISESYELAYNYPNKEKLQFVQLEKAGHGFGSTHLLSNTTAILEETINSIIEFIGNNND